ncbi:Golgi-associated plant pathogenesis-related protein 1-like [Ptychodera flava]|uniref:Golgi-associated plant pathogenesis-related protein 1-like n=1 Tax=Ptychodera flava TaxID=63121 RepID=UPI00396A80F3
MKWVGRDWILFQSYKQMNSCRYGETDANGCTVPNQQGNTGFADLYDQLLEAHNYFRCLHGVSALTWDDTLTNVGQLVANDNANAGQLQHSTYSYGENLAVSGLPSFDNAAGYGFVKMWYDEIDIYNYNNPGFSSGTGHFTQVVWANSQKVGCGIAQSGGSVYVACEYDPPGNYANQYETNVPPPL